MRYKIDYSKEQIFEGIKNSDFKVMEYIYQHYYPMIEILINNKYKGSNEDCKDIFQDILITIYERVISYPPLDIQYSFYTFLSTLCKRKMLKLIRKRSKNIIFDNEDELPPDQESEISSLIEKAERLKLFRKHFSEIGEKCQILLQLVLDGYTITEVTKQLNFGSESFTKKRRNQCKEILFKKIYSDTHLKELLNGKPWNIRKIPRW